MRVELTGKSGLHNISYRFFIRKKVSRISKYNCYTRWNKDYLICLCKVGNPACDRYNTCEVEEFEHEQFNGIKECMKHNKYKRVNRKIKQIGTQ